MAGLNSVAGSRTASLGRKRPTQLENSLVFNPRCMHSASISADERKSSPLGSHAWQAESLEYQARAVSVRALRNVSLLVTSAYSSARVTANELLKCVPTRVGYVALGKNSRKRCVNASASGASASLHRLPFLLACRFSSAESINSHAHPYGRSNVARNGWPRYLTSARTFAAVSWASNSFAIFPASRISGKSRSTVARSQYPCTHECQSKLPKHTGCSSRGDLRSERLLST